MFFEGSDQLRTDGSVGCASGCHVGGREFNSGQTLYEAMYAKTATSQKETLPSAR